MRNLHSIVRILDLAREFDIPHGKKQAGKILNDSGEVTSKEYERICLHTKM